MPASNLRRPKTETAGPYQRGLGSGWWLVISVVFTVLAAPLGGPAYGVPGPGDLDRAFGRDGKVRAPVPPGQFFAVGGEVPRSGGIIVGGHLGRGLATAGDRFVVLARRSNGSVDRRFGDDGRAEVVLPQQAAASAFALQAASRPLVLGTHQDERGYSLVRFTATGRRDASFGTDGLATASTFTSSSALVQARALAIQQDGKILVGGSSRPEASGPSPAGSDMAVARYLPDGELDPSFGDQGRLEIRTSDLNDAAAAIEVSSNGDIVIAGNATDPERGVTTPVVARLRPDGALDSTFQAGGAPIDARGGIGLVRVDDTAVLTSISLDTKGRIAIGGYLERRSSGTDFFAARLTPEGARDSGFGSGGVAFTRVAPGSRNDLAFALATDRADRITLVGATLGARGERDRFALARFASSGALDQTFGSGGRRTVRFRDRNAWAREVAFQHDGRLVVVGSGPVRGGRRGDRQALIARLRGASDRTAPRIRASWRCGRSSASLRVRVIDASSLAKVAVSVDGQHRVSSRRKRLLVAIRDTHRGHRVRVIAKDLAGNRNARVVRLQPCP